MVTSDERSPKRLLPTPISYDECQGSDRLLSQYHRHVLDAPLIGDLEFDRFARGEHSYGEVWK